MLFQRCKRECKRIFQFFNINLKQIIYNETFFYNWTFFSFYLQLNSQTANTSPLPGGETVIGGHLHAGAGNELWTDAGALYFNYRGSATSTFFWNLGGNAGKSIMSILNNGKVGIGINDPQNLLHIKSSNESPYIRLDKPGIEFECGLAFGINGSSDHYIYTDDSNNSLKIQAAGEADATPRMEFPSSNRNIYMALSGGSVGIGTSTPGDAPLKIYKSENPYLELTSSFSNLQLAMATADWAWANGSKKGDAVFRTRGGDHHGLVFFMNNNNNDGASYIKFGDGANNLWFEIMNNRTVRIDGSVYAKELTIQANVWADDVFSSSYKLMPLSEIETFVNTNKHLPGVPSEIEVKEEGINVAKMNEILLRKVEELTLHVIELNKTIDGLVEKINTSKK